MKLEQTILMTMCLTLMVFCGITYKECTTFEQAALMYFMTTTVLLWNIYLKKEG